MPANIRADVRDLNLTIPPALVEIFVKQPRIVVKWPPAPGLIPIDIAVMRQLVERLAADREFGKQFNESFEVVIVAK